MQPAIVAGNYKVTLYVAGSTDTAFSWDIGTLNIESSLTEPINNVVNGEDIFGLLPEIIPQYPPKVEGRGGILPAIFAAFVVIVPWGFLLKNVRMVRISN